MSVHWHGGNLGYCPCDEGEKAFPEVVAPPEPEVELIVDYDGTSDEWFGRCAEHGEILRSDGSMDAHNLVVITLAQHDERLHDGDGKMHWSAWLR